MTSPDNQEGRKEGAAMSNRYDSKGQWEDFRKLEAKRFGMPLDRYKDFFKRYPEYDRLGWIDNRLIHEQILRGKPEIAAFMGISVKTLEVWHRNNKFPDLPVSWGNPVSYAITDELLYWKTRIEFLKIPEGLKRTAIAYLAGCTIRDLREKYIPVTQRTIFQTRYSERKILEAAHLIQLRRQLQSNVEEIISKICKTSPPIV
jgi:hypothetical protein